MIRRLSQKESVGFFHPDPQSDFASSSFADQSKVSLSRSKVTDDYVKELMKNNRANNESYR